jgi:hypothetical protein
MKLAENPNLSLAVLDFRLRFENSLPVAAKLHSAGVPFIFHSSQDLSILSTAWPHVPVVAKPALPVRLVSALLSLVNAPRGMGGPRVA